jgi:hypothetical protein
LSKHKATFEGPDQLNRVVQALRDELAKRKVEWYYMDLDDKEGKEFGPYPQSEMRSRYKNGGFGERVGVKLEEWYHFHPIRDLYPDHGTTFEGTPHMQKEEEEEC